MCSNFETIKPNRAQWLRDTFDCELPTSVWRSEAYPTYPAPFIYLDNGKPKCELAQFGLVPAWAIDKRKFGLKTYNARSETVTEKPSYRQAWRQRHFGLAIMESFFEPNWESGKAVRWRIKRTDDNPVVVASIWDRAIDKETGEVLFSFSMLTINADHHAIMNRFHKPDDEKRSIVVLQNQDYLPWLYANHEQASNMLQLAPKGFLSSTPHPR